MVASAAGRSPTNVNVTKSFLGTKCHERRVQLIYYNFDLLAVSDPLIYLLLLQYLRSAKLPGARSLRI